MAMPVLSDMVKPNLVPRVSSLNVLASLPGMLRGETLGMRLEKVSIQEAYLQYLVTFY